MIREPYQKLNFDSRKNIIEVFNSFPKWNGIDYIKNYAEQAKIEHWKRKEFNYCFKSWFLAMVRNVIDDNFMSISSLVLLGKEGSGKSNFIKSILPNALKDYFEQMDQSPSGSALDSETLIINIIVELSEFSFNEINSFEQFGLWNKDKRRFCYHKEITEHKRLASYIITSQDNRLKSLIANPKYSVFDINDFRLHRLMNTEQMFAQALELLSYRK